MNTNKNIEKLKKNKYHNMADEQKQKYIETQKHRYHNMTDEQKQKYIET